MDDNKQQEFVSWLSDKLQAKDQNDLQKKLQTLGDDGIKKAYDQFMDESQDSEDNGGQDQDPDSGVQSNKAGGQLQYIKCLQAFAKGGMLEASKCGCGGKMKDGGLVNTGKMTIKKDKGSIKDSDKADKSPGKKQYIGHKKDAGEYDDKPGKMKKPSEMKKGGTVDQGDCIGMGENGMKLDPTKGMKKGGTMKEEMKKGGAMKHATGGNLTAKLVSLATGGRIDEDKATDQSSGIKNADAPEKKGLKGKRKDINTKEGNPGAKQWMDLGNKKKEHSAVTKLVKKQAGGAMAGTMGGMAAGAGMKTAKGPQLVKKKMKAAMA